MKRNKVEHHTGKRFAAVLISLFVLLALAIGMFTVYHKLRDLWLEQCVITDLARQVTVTTGSSVRGDAIVEAFGLRRGVNLATTDFKAKRKEVLQRYPIIRSLSVVRHLPDRVEISVIEREPIARVELVGRNKAPSGRVVDSEGVVFIRRRRTGALPIIREKPNAATEPGQRLQGRSLAALRLLDASRDPQFSELELSDIDTSSLDYLLATIGSTSTAKFAWEGMDGEDDNGGRTAMLVQLKCLHDAAIKSHLVRSPANWNVTVPNRAYVNLSGVK